MFKRHNQINVVDRIEHFASALTTEQIESLYVGEQADLMLESVTLEDLENTLLFQCSTEPQMMLEAFKAKASQLSLRVKKFANQLERQTPNLTCGAVEISKPRKSGAVAVQVAKIPLSDGQSVSIAFHAPDNDPLKINSSDTLIAFRFLLNSRDITHVVAPKGGKDVSLKEATTKLGSLAENNSSKFSAAQAKKATEAAELAEAQAKTLEIEEQTASINEDVTANESELLKAEKKINRFQEQIDTQNELQEELRKQLKTKPKLSEQKATENPSSTDVSTGNDPDVEPVVALFRDPKLKAAIDLALKVEGGKRAFSTLGTIADIDVNGAKGWDRSGFVSNMVSRIRTLHKNDDQKAVDAILSMIAAYNDAAPKAAVTPRNGIWSLASVDDSDVDIDLNSLGTDYDPESGYSHDNSIKGINKFAQQYGVTVVSVNGGVKGFDNLPYGTTQAKLTKHGSTAFMQIAGDGKMAMFDSNGQRLDGFPADEGGKYTFFSGYSNDDGTLEERIRLFADYADRKQSTIGDSALSKVKGLIENNVLPSLLDSIEKENAKGQRAKLSHGLKSAIKGAWLELERSSASSGLKNEKNTLAHAANSIYANTALNELVNGGWVDPSVEDNVVRVSFNKAEFESNVTGQDNDKVKALRDAGYEVLFEDGVGFSFVLPSGKVIATGVTYAAFKDRLDYHIEQVTLDAEIESNASTNKPADQHDNYGYLVEDSGLLPTKNSLNKLKPSDLDSGEYAIEYGDHCHISVKKDGNDIQATWVVAGGLDVETVKYSSVSKLKHFGTQKMSELGGKVSSNLYQNHYTQEELDKASGATSNVVNLSDTSEVDNATNRELKKVGDVVRIGDSVCIIERIDTTQKSVTLYDREDDYRFRADEHLLERNSVFVEGIHQSYKASSHGLSLVDELKPIIKDLPTDGWFYDNGNPTFKFNDDLYDALRAAGYSMDDSRIKAQQLKDELIMGNVDYFANFKDQPVAPSPKPSSEKVDVDDDLFWYGLRARPFSMGAVPSIQQSSILNSEQANLAFPNAGNSVRHGAVGYSDILSADNVSNFEFVPLFEGSEAVTDEDVETTIRELLLGWMERKGIESIDPNALDTLSMIVKDNGASRAFSDVIREMDIFKDRKDHVDEYKQFTAELKSITGDLVRQVADEMAIIGSIKSDDADEASKGKTDEEKQLLALDPNEFSFGAIYNAEGWQDGKTIASRVRSFITQGKKQGKLPKDLKISVKNQRGGMSTALIMRINDLPESIQVNSDAAIQSAIDNDGSITFGQKRYTDELTNLIDYVEAYVKQFDNISGDAYGDYGSDHALYGINLQLDAEFSNERWAQELESFTERHQKGDESDEPTLDVNGVRDSLGPNEKLQLEQLEEFTDFKIKLGKQEITLPNGKVKTLNAEDEDELVWGIGTQHEYLVDALDEKAAQKLESLSDWQSEVAYNSDGTMSQIQISKGLNTNVPSDIDGLYGRNYLKAWIGEKSVSIYPIVKNAEFKFAAYYKGELLGEFDDHSALEALCIKGFGLSTQEPESNGEEVEYTEKLKAIRDYSGEVTQDLLDQYQADLEGAYGYFEANGIYAENEALTEAAFANYVALQDQAA